LSGLARGTPARRRLLRAAFLGLAALGTGLGSLGAWAWAHGQQRSANPPALAADAALVLGNRIEIDGRPNPCLTSRVDRGLQLARAGQVGQRLVSGGVDRESARIEAEAMAAHARRAGYEGVLLQEPASTSTRQNLLRSWPLLQAAGVKRVIVVSEPYHLWRVERLARASGFDGAFEVQYAASAADCGRSPLRQVQAALREPLAIVNNAVSGYFF